MRLASEGGSLGCLDLAALGAARALAVGRIFTNPRSICEAALVGQRASFEQIADTRSSAVVVVIHTVPIARKQAVEYAVIFRSERAVGVFIPAHFSHEAWRQFISRQPDSGGGTMPDRARN